ncbi:TPA: DUF3265 domain-containing protein [Vibrio diabolicus]|nr:DUF3265 domain-containing protein [Vibrio parahaemolyticus]
MVKNGLWYRWKLLYNKAFKTDSQRLAFSVLIGFSVYGTMV